MAASFALAAMILALAGRALRVVTFNAVADRAAHTQLVAVDALFDHRIGELADAGANARPTYGIGGRHDGAHNRREPIPIPKEIATPTAATRARTIILRDRWCPGMTRFAPPKRSLA